MPTANEMLSETDFQRLIDLVRHSNTLPSITALTAAQGSLEGLGIHARANVIASALLEDAGPSFYSLLDSLLQNPAFTGWMTLPLGEAVTRRATGNVDDSMEYLRRLTPLLTSEFSVRKMLAVHADEALKVIFHWVHDSDEHVRRLASESTRPRLPWGQRLDHLASNPKVAAEILTALHDDPSPYVRLSVSNHLNDVSKIKPATAIELATQWSDRGTATTSRLVAHGLRTLIKQAHPEALKLMGIDAELKLDVTPPSLVKEAIVLGDWLEFSSVITNHEDSPSKITVDYIVHFVKANGRTSPKTFKHSTRTLAPGETWRITRRHRIVPITTRKYYAGRHSLQLQVNGNTTPAIPFMLSVQ